MMKYNNLDLNNWKELDINVDSLWLIRERDKSVIFEIANGVNFIPQIPKNSVVIKKICKIENQDYELILLGNLQSDFRAFF